MSSVGISALQEELLKTHNELFTVKSDLERDKEDKRAILVEANNALFETEGLKAKVDNFIDIFGRIESAYKALDQEHEAKK